MDIVHRSLLKRSLIFTGRLALGVAMVLVAAFLGSGFFPIAFLGGVGAGYLLKKHLFWVMSALIGIVAAWVIAWVASGGYTGDFTGGAVIVLYLGWLAPVYLGGVVGYLVSRLVTRLRMQQSIKAGLVWVATAIIAVVGAQVLLVVARTDYVLAWAGFVLLLSALATPVGYLISWRVGKSRVRRQTRIS